jgi:hypothetical protein
MAYTPIHDYRGKDALPSGNSAKIIRGSELSEEFEAIRDDLATSPITVSCKYNGTELRYSKNVARVDQQGGTTWVYFKDQVEGFDDHYAVTVTPFVYLGDNSAGRMAISVLTGFTSEWVQFVTRVDVDGKWVDPTSGYGFSLLVVDIEQS